MPFKIKFLERIIQVNFQSVILVKNNTTFQHTFQPISQINMFNKCQTFQCCSMYWEENRTNVSYWRSFHSNWRGMIHYMQQLKQNTESRWGQDFHWAKQFLKHYWYLTHGKVKSIKVLLCDNSNAGGMEKIIFCDYGLFRFLDIFLLTSEWKTKDFYCVQIFEVEWSWKAFYYFQSMFI